MLQVAHCPGKYLNGYNTSRFCQSFNTILGAAVT
jgi:hypothetical protein